MAFFSISKSAVAEPNGQGGTLTGLSGALTGIIKRLVTHSPEALAALTAPAPQPPAQPSPLTALAQQSAAPAPQPTAEQLAAGAQPFTPATAPGAVVAPSVAAAPVQLPSWVARPDIAVGQPSLLAGLRAPEAMSAQYRVPNMQSGYTTLQAQLLRAYNPQRMGEIPGSPLGQYGMNPEDEQGGAPYGY